MLLGTAASTPPSAPRALGAWGRAPPRRLSCESAPPARFRVRSLGPDLGRGGRRVATPEGAGLFCEVPVASSCGAGDGNRSGRGARGAGREPLVCRGGGPSCPAPPSRVPGTCPVVAFRAFGPQRRDRTRENGSSPPRQVAFPRCSPVSGFPWGLGGGFPSMSPARVLKNCYFLLSPEFVIIAYKRVSPTDHLAILERGPPPPPASILMPPQVLFSLPFFILVIYLFTYYFCVFLLQ